MKTVEVNLFGRVVEPENFNELIEIITYELKSSSINVKLWRGQGDISWPIHSGAYRRIFNENLDSVKEEDIMVYEKRLIDQARHKSFEYQDGRMLTDIEILAKLQHHGAATRLVDFSKNALIALWFCSNSCPSKTGLLLGVHSSCVVGFESTTHASKSDYNSFADELSSKEYPMLLDPPIVSPRISAQHGLFLYSKVSDSPMGSLKLPNNENDRIFIAIKPQLKESIKTILMHSFNIRDETIFPDFDGFAAANSTQKSIGDMYRW
ncbi:FRG domain-containing protein [Bacillus sp. S0628]|uniref:FRG domain-containing protein n=1 Tax=Bacillus sp. S0628 TaxID=2957802 RepID=UPI00209F23C5|nr:FRG domain-containing protein [Bacillus sp. S0628]MCP1324504.1 FRG domain-containing protein [Bacillus sp. S0628]HDR6256901.1 FRG domain-containing protein [Bacillus cereus]